MNTRTLLTDAAYSLSPGTATAMNLFVTTGRGLEPFLLEEIQEIIETFKLPAPVAPTAAVAGVALQASFETVVALNMGLTIASRVTWTIREGYAPTAEAAYNLAYNLDWQKLFGVDNSFKVEAHCKDGFTQNSMFLALKIKDAIADAFREKTGKRPSVDPKNPDVTVIARLQGKRLTLSIDTSGETLTNHGYRVADGRAPLRENLAAGMVRATGWCALAKSLRTNCEPVFVERAGAKEKPDAPRRIAVKIPLLPQFADPMCGSGTLGIEAALALLNKKPNATRSHFAFEALHCFKGKEFSAIRLRTLKNFESNTLSTSELLAKISSYIKNINSQFPELEFRNAATPIVAGDIDSRAVGATVRNAKAAAVDSLIEAGVASFFDEEATNRGGIMVLNPPYGERLEDEEAAIKMHEDIGSALKHRYKGWMAWIISSNAAAIKRIGLRPTRKFALYNGQLPCQYQQYILY